MRTLKLGFLLVFLAALFVLPVAVAADSPFFRIVKVEVNDLDVTDVPRLDFERGDAVDIEVTVQGNETISGGLVDDVRISAQIFGYEFGTIEDFTDIFSIEAGNVLKKQLRLFIPDDIDSSERYTLRIEVADTRDEDQLEFELHVDERRHDTRIFPNGIILTPSNRINAGQPVFVTVRVENKGEKKEEDVRVTAAIPKLGVSASDYIDELVTELQEEEEQFKFGEESSNQIDLLLRIPEDAPSGEYDVEVTVEYNRGYSTSTGMAKLFVEGEDEEEDVESIINIDSTSKQVGAGSEAVYKLTIANLGEERGIYSVQVEGASPWADARVEPSFLTVMAESSGEAFIYIIPHADAQAKDYLSVARVLRGTDVLQEISLHTKVTGAATGVGGATFKTVLAVVFGVLVIVLIVLGIIIALRRAGEEEAPSAAEGQSFYYSPRR